MKIKLLLILVTVLVGFLLNKFSWQGEDISILLIDNDKVKLVNVSPQRGMVNTYLVENMDLWIPNGMGWYPASRLGLIVKDDTKLAQNTVFYNFGFWPKYILKQSNWNDTKTLVSMLGPVGFIKYRLQSDGWLWKSDNLKLNDLKEIVPRDMADNRIVSSDIKINVINASGKDGFGNMIADRLEWFGLMVTSVQTFDIQKLCQINVENVDRQMMTANILSKIFNCKIENRPGLFELILGTDNEEMVKYSQTYVRAF